MTDRLKIVRIRARNVPRVPQALDDDASLAPLAPGKRRCRVLDAPGRRTVETQKSRPVTIDPCLSASEQEGCHDSILHSL